MTAQRVYDYDSLAERVDVVPATLRKYMKIARRNRAAGVHKPYDLPEPDLVIGSSPVWFSHTVETWIKARPGKAHGTGGRRKKEES